MSAKKSSPTVESIKWGQLSTSEGETYKDAKLYPGGSRAWDWNETGTHHRPGIQPADVEELLENGAEILVLSKGYHERLQVCDKTKQMLEKNDIEYYILDTDAAVETYNKLCNEHPTGALIHSTC